MLFTTTTFDRNLRGIGIVTDFNGKPHYFRTAEFEQPLNKHWDRPKATYDERTHQLVIPPRDTSNSIYDARFVTLELPDGHLYVSKTQINMAQIAVQNLGFIERGGFFPITSIFKSSMQTWRMGST